MRSAPSSVEDYVASAQREIVEQEIFSLLVQEASNLPTASTKVSERLIVIEAAQATELKFELVCLSLAPLQQALNISFQGRLGFSYQSPLTARPNDGGKMRFDLFISACVSLTGSSLFCPSQGSWI